MLGVLLVGVIAYRIVACQVPSADLPANERVYEIFAEGGCLDCHSADPDLPFYSSFPIMGDMVKQDAAEGYRAFDMTGFMEAVKADADVNLVDLTKVEKVVLDDRMPMAKYYLVHWGSSLNDDERQIVLDWAAQMRAGFYEGARPVARVNEPVAPIEDFLDYEEVLSNPKVALGYALYHDPRLSIDNTVSCATCHELENAGVDNHQYSHGVNDQLGGVNTMQSITSFSSGTAVRRLSQIRLQVRRSILWRWPQSHSSRSLRNFRPIRSLQMLSQQYIRMD